MNVFKCNITKDDCVLIQLNICSICQQHCWYCYARNGKCHIVWNKILPFNFIKKIINAIGYMRYNVRLSILGGEPLLHPNFNDILLETLKYDNIKKVDIFSNGLKSIKKYVIDPKIFYTFSFHSVETNGLKLIENANFCLKNNVNFDINCLYYEDNANFLSFFKTIKDTPIISHSSISIVYNYIDDTAFKIVVPDKYKCLYAEQVKKFNVDGVNYNLEEVFKHHFNNFKGWKCYKQNIWITTDGRIYVTGSKNRYLTLNELRNYKITYDICTHSGCTDEDSLMYNKKELNEYQEN